MGSFDIGCDRIRPTITLEPLIQQETELLTFSSITNQPQSSPLIRSKKSIPRHKKHSHLQRRSPTFLTLKYTFVIFVITSSVATLCDINKLKADLIFYNQNQESSNLTLSIHSNETIDQPQSTTISSTINNSNQPLVPMIILPGNMSISTHSYRLWVHHKMKIPLYTYMAVSVGVLFVAIFGRTMENFFIPFGFGMFMLLEIGIMFGLSLKEAEFGLGYSSYLWTIYILHVIFSFSYSLIILIMQNHL